MGDAGAIYFSDQGPRCYGLYVDDHVGYYSSAGALLETPRQAAETPHLSDANGQKQAATGRRGLS